MASRNAGKALVGTLPSSSVSVPDVGAFVPSNISRSSLPMSVKPWRISGSTCVDCSAVRIRRISYPLHRRDSSCHPSADFRASFSR
jgi:hypothetical protein